MITVREILSFIDELAPFDTQCEWDNSGLILGDMQKPVSNAAFCLDLTSETLDMAASEGAELIITHHPAIFGAKKRIYSDDPVYKAIRLDIPVISVHTCLDCAEGGVNDVLCSLLELKDIRLLPTNDCPKPMVRIGKAGEKKALNDFAAFAAEKLQTTVRVSDAGRPVENVAVCGGSAMDFAKEIALSGADTYITGDAKHHELLDAAQLGLNVIAAGHFETENPVMVTLEAKVSERFPGLKTILIKQPNPVSFIG